MNERQQQLQQQLDKLNEENGQLKAQDAEKGDLAAKLRELSEENSRVKASSETLEK